MDDKVPLQVVAFDVDHFSSTRKIANIYHLLAHSEDRSFTYSPLAQAQVQQQAFAAD